MQQRDLVDRARTGDHDAFATLIAAAHDRLFRTARLILRADDAAADAVQEATVAAWLHIRSVRDPERFDAWLHRLTVHACYREARKTTRRRLVQIDVAYLQVDPDDSLGAAAVHDQLERGFRRLTPEQRAVLVVHHYLGLSDAEAAAVLDIPLGTVKSRLNRATAALRAALEADERAQLAVREPVA
jgi:RNA polymerase sigma-70 factor, ECF subfamily